MKDKNIGVINEVGDLGLGFYALNESDVENIEKHEDDKEE